jgi:CHAD domain-containing protein
MHTTTEHYAAQHRAGAYLRAWTRTLGDTLPSVDGVAAVVDRHRARVSVRRLRVGLEVFATLYPAGELCQMQRQLRRVGRELGAVRALDVNSELLRDTPRQQIPARQRALAALDRERVAQIRKLAAMQRLWRTGRLVDRLERMIGRPQRRLDSARLLERVREGVNDRRKTMRRRYAQYEKKQGGRAFHRLRIAVKQYRYALLAAGATFPMPNRKREKALAEVQDLMGAGHDVEVLLDWLRDRQETLGPGIKKLIDIFERKHEQSLAICRKHLAEETGWRKKVKLELET